MKYALISVSDKTGVVELARGLIELGYELISSGGTAGSLRERNIAVTDVADHTGAPEILGGRVKTLHPRVHGGILARSTAEHLTELAMHGIPLIDIVVCNLYPFEKTVSGPNISVIDAVENIDIGGVTLIRAAAKNFERVLLLCDPEDYTVGLEKLRCHTADVTFRRKLAIKGFMRTANYDKAIHQYFFNLE